MEAVHLQLFHELWLKLVRILTPLEASINTFLDYLQTRPEIDFAPNWYNLVIQNRELLFDKLGPTLAITDGFKILLDYVREKYKWLYDEYTSLQKLAETTQHAIDKALKYGNIPAQPKFYIVRSKMLNDMKAKLLQVRPSSSTTNIFGMDGTGKTNLIAACLRDPDILINTNYKVYWIDLNRDKYKSDNELLDRMYKLYHKLQIDDVSLADLPTENPGNIELMKERLLNLFTREQYNKAIIVLDNVTPNSYKQIDYFKVCRLIIVSQERFDFEDQYVLHVPIQGAYAFTPQETLDVFRQALGGDVTPNEHLNAVIEWCRGDLTTTISCANLMVDRKTSLLNKENAIKVWKRFKEDLCKKDSRVTTKRNTTIEMRLKTLPDALRLKYFDFAIFVHDVNITVNVLSLLWDIDQPIEIEDIMLELCNKSFALREYNEYLDEYVYGVNHLYSNYLKSKHTALQDIHCSLIEAYKNKYGVYHKFRDDNYIYQYIGYHLQEAGFVDDFDIYRDLKFLEAKIRATGIADVLRDFEIYYDHITRQNSVFEKLVNELEEFVERFGQNIEKYPHTNILQSALQLPADSLVYQLAVQELKVNDQFGLFFDWLLPKKNKHYIHQLSIKQNLEVACFTYDDPNYLLIGTANGDIQLWDQKYDKVLQEFKGHTKRVIYLQASECKFLSISDDGTVKVWTLDNKSRRNSFVQTIGSDNDMNIPSPACIKQKNYQNFFPSNFVSDNFVTYEATKDFLISADFSDELLVAGTVNGKLLLWRNEEQLFEKELKIPISAVKFSHDFNYIYAALKTDVLVYAAAPSGDFVSKACCKDEILSLHTLQCDNIDAFIVVQKKQVVMCKIKLREEHYIEIDKKIIMTNIAENTCSSITNKYLVIGSNDNKIHMWDLTEMGEITQFDTQYGHVICIDAMTNLNDYSIEILLTSFEDRSLKLWHINPEETSLQQAEKVDAFAAYWQPTRNNFVTAIIRQNKLTINETTENNDVKEVATSIDEVVKVVNFNNSFVFACKTGKVSLWNKSSSLALKIMNLRDDITYLEALDNMVVAGTQKGVLFVYYKDSAYKLRGESRREVQDHICCSFIVLNKLVVVSQKKISYWDLTFDSEKVIYAPSNATLQVACVTSNKLCVAFEDSFKVIDFTLCENTLQIGTCIVKKTQSKITACCFSKDGKYLALGTQSGDIEVFDAECLTLSSTLKLHTSPVNFVKFSPDEGPILLSVGEQIAWWNVKLAHVQLAHTPARRSFRSRSNSGKSPGKKPTTLNLLADMDLTDVVMLTKRGRFDKEYLLSAIKLHGMSAAHVVSGDKFRSFLSVDNLGNLYNLRVIDSDRFALSPLETPLV